MIARIISTGIVFWTLVAAIAAAQEGVPDSSLGRRTVNMQEAQPATFSGRVITDGRCGTKMIEVRLERQDSSLISNAYTMGGCEFSFKNVMISPIEKSYIIVRESGYIELTFPLSFDEFHQDRDVFVYKGGTIFLDLQKAPVPGEGQLARPTGVGFEQLNIPGKAVKEYERALKDFAKGNNDTAIAHLENAVQLAPNYFDALNKLGTEYLKARQNDKAESLLNQAHLINPNDPATLSNLGALYFQEGEKSAAATPSPDAPKGQKPGEVSYLKAVDVLEKALKLEPQSPRTNLYLGTVLYRMGNFARAESLLTNALAQDQKMQDARFTLLNMYLRQLRFKEALEQISAYLAGNPSAPQREQLEKVKKQLEVSMNK
jgi:Flp pilus assembly protein TadD